MNNKKEHRSDRFHQTLPGFHKDLRVIFWIIATGLIFNAFFIGYSEQGRKMALAVLAVHLLLGLPILETWCFFNPDPRSQRRVRTKWQQYAD